MDSYGFYFLESTLNPSYTFSPSKLVYLLQEKQPQPDDKSLQLRGSAPSIVDFFETAPDRLCKLRAHKSAGAEVALFGFHEGVHDTNSSTVS